LGGEGGGGGGGGAAGDDCVGMPPGAGYGGLGSGARPQPPPPTSSFPAFRWGDDGGIATTMASGGLGLGFGGDGSRRQPPPANAAAIARTKDPNLGKWEMHTKGIGMRLLQKMGYEGSGGLGSKRRRAAAAAAVVVVDSPAAATPSSAGGDGDAKGGRGDRPGTATPAAKFDDNREEVAAMRKGISRPVEVVVRPHGLGLGYGNFKEQTRLKVNRQIEAEVRGIELPEDDDDANGRTKKVKRDESSLYDGIDNSLLPSTESLLSGGRGSWRRGNKKPKRKIIHYQDILDESKAGDGSNKMKIIDMRGAAAIVSKDDGVRKEAGRVVPIGEELLHNVTLVLNTHEGQLRTSSYMVQGVERKIANLEAEIKEMSERKEAIRNRRKKMKLALDVIEEAEGLIDDLTSKKSSDMHSIEKLDFVMNSLQRIFVKLYGNFTKEDRDSLKFESTLIPSIVTPLLDALTSSLSPLKINTTWMDHLASCIQKLCGTVGSDDEACALREIVILHGIVPWIQSSLSSSKWDPVRNVEGGLGIYEALVGCACTSLLGAEPEDNEILKESINDEVVQTAVLPKLMRAVNDWRPKFDDERRIDCPLHLWILPWLPYINSDSMFGTLLDNVRRNLTKALSFLGKSVSNDVEFIRLCLATLSPWEKLFDNATIFHLTSDSVSPRFARSLVRVKICIEPAEQDWEHLHVLFVYFEGGVMSGNDFISLIEGEVLPAWAHALYRALQHPDRDMNAIKRFYTAWRGRIFDSSARIINGSPSAHHTLRSDSVVCRYFFGGLKMIQAAIESNQSLLESLEPPDPAECNYRISLMHRSRESTVQNDQQQPIAINVRTGRKTNGQNRTEASFQEVVEAFASQRGITFHPKTKTGSNSMIDGKPVFMFGDHPVYLDKNVIFTLRGTNWQPISLEHLAQAC
jgi:tuftelin-interacting protein 11